MNNSKLLNDQLTADISNELPLKAFPTRGLVRVLKNSDIHITLKTELKIISVYNSEDISGIMCVIESDNINGLVCALTHLELINGQNLYKDILKYQTKRISKLKMSGQF